MNERSSGWRPWGVLIATAEWLAFWLVSGLWLLLAGGYVIYAFAFWNEGSDKSFDFEGSAIVGTIFVLDPITLGIWYWALHRRGFGLPAFAWIVSVFVLHVWYELS